MSELRINRFDKTFANLSTAVDKSVVFELISRKEAKELKDNINALLLTWEEQKKETV